ncbi:mevalonate kinase [Nematocida displodere]|uniref:Mevalonate kinase n=1 Tax=Nematocida displodere TaxID=1805483 RepID=A0A177EK82_9MICR|nr:mevalonate kinase [Nematocida displodere]
MSREKENTGLSESTSPFQTFTLTIPSKLILFGEHTLFVGAPAVSAALSFGSEGIIHVANTRGPSKITITRKQKTENSDVPHDLHRLHPGITIQFFSDVRVACGLGTSAMLALSAAAAEEARRFLIRGGARKKVFGLTEKAYSRINKKAFAMEEKLSVNVSGVDHATILKGGMMSYRLGGIKPEIVKIETSFFKEHVIILWESALPKSCPLFLEMSKGRPEWKETQGKLGQITARALKELSKEAPSLQRIYQLLREDQHLLFRSGLSSEEAETEIAEMRKLGVEAKIASEGTGGYVFTIVPRSFPLRPRWFPCEINKTGLVLRHKTS